MIYIKNINISRILFLFITCNIIWISCKDKESYPIEPKIEYKNMVLVPFNSSLGGSAWLTLSFTDGDGDIGLSEQDSVAPMDYNLFIELFYQDSGKMKPVIFPDESLTYNARIPVLTTNSHNKTLKGEIEYKMDLFSNDTLQMHIYIKDRALHLSNKITTPKFTIKGGVII